jgi:2-isopropylmalate synthase
VDATLKTIERITKVHGRLMDFSLQAISMGEDAMGEVSIRVGFNADVVISAKAASTDIVEASAKAYLSCVNRYLQTRELNAASRSRPSRRAGKARANSKRKGQR